jgi:GMP synthase (glutamine-hydrolysing)
VTVSPIVVLVTGDPVATTRATRGDFVDLIRGAAPTFATRPWVAYDVRASNVVPDLTGAWGVIVTGSPCSVTERLPWIEQASSMLARAVRTQIPVLGICFGHQLLGHALGGRVALNPRGRELGTVSYTNRVHDPVLGEPATWLVNSSHLDSVVELPAGVEVLGSTALEPHAAVRFGARAWGVQFHPEFDAAVVRQYIEARRAALLDEGIDPSELETGAADAPRARGLIERFLRVATESRP